MKFHAIHLAQPTLFGKLAIVKMATTENKRFHWQAHKPLLATALAVAGVFNMVGAVLADVTPAGTEISNTATATYNDGKGGNFNATSNTVIIKVAEIAGLTAVASTPTDVDGGAIEKDDELIYTFTITNVGNAVTGVFVPDITGFRTANFTPTGSDPVTVVRADGTTINVQSGGSIIDAVAPDESFEVRVTGTPAAGTIAGNPVSVTLGNTDENTTSEGSDPTQNQRLDEGASNLDDLRTVNIVGTDVPQNGEREAQASSSAEFASSIRPLALATVLKTASFTTGKLPNDSNDDLITYNLGLRVEDKSPSQLFQPASLKGTKINLNSGTQERILVSDAIPKGTVLSSVSTSLPTGWTAVYSTDPTASAPGNDPLKAAWTTTAPANLSTVTRVGFVFNNTIGATGTTTTGLSFTVITSALNGSKTVENIAQVFGQTVGDPNDTDNDPNTTPQIIYDESGDSNPNNFNDDGSLPPTDVDNTGSQYTPGINTGIADAANQDTDTAGNNTGIGPDGEVNVVRLTFSDDILNGPQNTPDAVGPTSDNDDFTNKSTPTPPAGTKPVDSFDPISVTFDNSLKNPASTSFISNVTVQPIAPSRADIEGVAGQYGKDADIPAGTTVTITKPANGPTAAVSATYTYDPVGSPTGTGIFKLNSGSTPVNFGDVVAGANVNYTVTVDLPANTSQLISVSIPLIAFPDDNPTGTPGFTGETTSNITIDRLYTGFMSLLKEARVLQPNGSPKLDSSGSDPGFSTNPLQAGPGEFIEYRISYENISKPAGGGSGSVDLTANNFLLIEKGNGVVGTAPGAPTNNWASLTTHQQNTLKTKGTVEYRDNGTLLGTNDPNSGTAVDEYRNVVGSVAPSSTGTFTFRRVVRRVVD